MSGTGVHNQSQNKASESQNNRGLIFTVSSIKKL